jgi:signal transduction histidine kinase
VVIEEVVLNDQLVSGQGPEGSGPNGPAAGSASSGADLHSRLSIVPPGAHRLEFRFTGLSLVAPEKVRFRYRLDEFDRDWIEAGMRRTAYYTSIPPGRYRFRVIACNNDGVWNHTGASLALVVQPQWWQTWWFRAVAALGLAGLVFGWYERRLLRLRREHAAQTAFAHRLIDSQEEERKRIAAELHDSLGQDLLVIKNRALLGLREPATTASATEQLGEISRMASHSLEEVRQISRNLRPYQIDRLGLTKALQAMADNMSRASGLPCAVQVIALDGLLPPQFEIHFYRIAQELLNNVVKHSDASQCRMSVQHQDGRIILSVEDDGRGFQLPSSPAQEPSPRGLGLNDIAERVRILGGTWNCDSRPGHGTRWRIEIPTSPNETQN